MTDPNLELTPEEQSALDRDNRMMEVLRRVNQNSGMSFQSLFPGAKPVSQLHYWAGIARPDARAKLKLAISSGEDVNEKGDDDYTPLHAAAERGILDHVTLLVAHGANTAAKTVDGQTPLDLARTQGHSDVVTFLESPS